MRFRRQHLRNDIARLAHADHIPDTNILFRDKLLIMQNRTRNARSRKRNRLKDRNRRQHARAPHLNINRKQLRDLLLRREFVGNCPFRVFRRCTQRRALRKRIHLDDHAVNIIRQIAA